MRNFSKSEKESITKIVEVYKSNNWNELVLKNLIYSRFQRTISLEELPGFELLVGESDKTSNIIGYTKAIQNGYIPIGEFICLLQVLEANALVSVIPYFETNDFLYGYIGENNTTKKYFSIANHAYLKYLKDNSSNLIHPSQELIELVNDDFLTKDERRYKCQMFATWISILVAFLIGLFGLVKSSSPIKIDKNQINQIISEINRNTK